MDTATRAKVAPVPFAMPTYRADDGDVYKRTRDMTIEDVRGAIALAGKRRAHRRMWLLAQFREELQPGQVVGDLLVPMPKGRRRKAEA